MGVPLIWIACLLLPLSLASSPAQDSKDQLWGSALDPQRLILDLLKLNEDLKMDQNKHLVRLRTESPDLNKKPVIGILTQPLEPAMKADSKYQGFSSFILASYVKYIQAQGAQVVPLIFGEEEESLDSKLSKLNGILIPGGNVDFSDFGRQIFERVRSLNDEGQTYPILGVCMGHEYLAMYTASDPNKTLGDFKVDHESLTLNFSIASNLTNSLVFYDLNEDDEQLFASTPMTINLHDFAIDPSFLTRDKGLDDFWRVTSLSYMPDENRRPFIATMEARSYPFFSTQFHPEKASQQWGDDEGFNHSWDSIRLQGRFGKKLVRLARLNLNTFGTYEDLQPFLISNHPTVKSPQEGRGEIFVF